MEDTPPQATAAAFSQFQPESLAQVMEDYKRAEEVLNAANAKRIAFIAAIKQVIEQLNIRPDELGMQSYPPKKPLPPKFHNPETGETWHGWGHRPAWIPSELKTKDLEQFRIKD